MTSDAKIGLLLGLVFIFIIAFVVNGLPRLRAEPDSNELTIIGADSVVSSENPAPGLGERERGTEGVFETWAPEQRQVESDSGTPRSSDESVQPFADTTGLGGDERVRYQVSLPRPLPASTDELLSFGPRGVSLEPGWLGQRQRPTTQKSDGGGLLANFLGRHEPVSEPEPVVVSPSPSLLSDAVSEMEVRQAAQVSLAEEEKTIAPPVKSQVQEIERPRPITPKRPRQRSQWPKEYVVSDGDNLAVIAKKFYGEEEGNRRVNIDLIFKANSKTLKSPNLVKVGQKLRIPVLPDAQEPQQASIFPKSLIERVKAMAPRSPRIETPRVEKTVPASGGRFYVAKDGDSLWKIAADQLGKGSRYVEIFELNNDIMKDATNVVPGMRLRMPAN